MRRLRIAGLALLLAALTLVSTAGPTLAWATSEFSPNDEQLLFTLTNQDRASAGLNALVNDSYLHKEAEWRARDMGERDYFSHQIPPDNKMVFSYMQQDGYCFTVAGENIGLSTFGDDVATTRIETAFMGSKGHRANILGTWQRLGVGAYQAADGRKVYAILFSMPCGAKSTPVSNPTATAVPTATVAPSEMPVATEPTATPTASVVSPAPVPSLTAGPASSPTSSVESALPGDGSISLRVREKGPSQGPLDSLFQLVFGGPFG